LLSKKEGGKKETFHLQKGNTSLKRVKQIAWQEIG
jgi:hypothetical protein